MDKLNSLSPDQLRLRLIQGELEGLRTVLAYLWDGEQEAFNALLFLKQNYKRWNEMFIWLKNNKIRGKKLVEFFQNESFDQGHDSGGGYHMGATKIISALDGMKHSTRSIKIDELVGYDKNNFNN